MTEIELSKKPLASQPDAEHLFLVLDKNVQGIPWESIPILRGRAISRIPSLPFLLDQIDTLGHEQSYADREPGGDLTPALANLSLNTAGIRTPTGSAHKIVDHRKVFYILNPSGDLAATQTRLEPLVEKNRTAGWKGIVGRRPTELEMQRAVQDNDLVL